MRVTFRDAVLVLLGVHLSSLLHGLVNDRPYQVVLSMIGAASALWVLDRARRRALRLAAAVLAIVEPEIARRMAAAPEKA